jgi:hypothetical protein
MTDLARLEPRPIPAETNISPMVAMIERIAMDPSIPIDRLEQMLAMKERLDAKAAEQAFAAAFALASSEFPNIPMNGKGDKQKPYALLKDIIGYTRPVLSQHGLALSFGVESHIDRVIVTAELMHIGGYRKTTAMELPKDTSGSKNAVQAVGSSQTYGQRYTAQALLGLSLGDDTDDDGKSATGGKIDADQYFELRNLMDRAEADEAKFCAYLKVTNLEELPTKLFANAVSALRKKIKDGAAR